MKMLKKLLAVGIAVTMAVTSLFACGKTPKEKVEDAFKSLGNMNAAAKLGDELGITAVMDKMDDKAFTCGMKLVFEDTDISELAMFTSAYIDAFIAEDTKEAKALMGIGVGYAATELLSARMYLDEKQIAVALPDLLDKVICMDMSGDLDERLEKSILMKREDMEGLDFAGIADMWNNRAANTGDDEAVKFVLGFEEKTKAVKKFKDAVSVDEAGSKEFEINGSNRKCDGYDISVPKAALKELLKEIADYYFSEEAKAVYGEYIDTNTVYDEAAYIIAAIDSYISDIEIEMYVYDGEIAFLEAVTKIDNGLEIGMPQQSFEVGIEFECKGGEYSIYDNYELAIKVMSLDMLTLTRTTDSTGDEYKTDWIFGGIMLKNIKASADFMLNKKNGSFEIDMSFDNESDNIGFNVEGAVKADKKKSVTVELDSIKVMADQKLTYEFSGECYIESGAEPDMPEGEKFDILTEKQAEWDEFMNDINNMQNAFYKIFAKLGGI